MRQLFSWNPFSPRHFAIVLGVLFCSIGPRAWGDPVRQLRASGGWFLPGQTGAVTVVLVSLGNENALGFSLSVDPAVFSFGTISLATGGTGATLEVNTNQALSGQLGLVLALPIGRSFASGNQELVQVTLIATNAGAGIYPLALTDHPVPREISDANAQVLSTDYLNGALALKVKPLLSLSFTNAHVSLSWPLWANDFALQSSPSLPGETWTNVPLTDLVRTNENSLSLPASVPAKFFRLFKP